MANSRAWRSCEMTESIAALALEFAVLFTVFITAKHITVNASPTTTTISRSENPSCALLVRFLIPELLRLLPTTCRVPRRVHVPSQALWIAKDIIFSSLRGRDILKIAGVSLECNEMLQVATSETVSRRREPR